MEGLRVERFGVRWFLGSDDDIRLHWTTHICLIVPLLGHLMSTDDKHPSAPNPRTHKPRPRVLQPIDEL